MTLLKSRNECSSPWIFLLNSHLLVYGSDSNENLNELKVWINVSERKPPNQKTKICHKSNFLRKEKACHGHWSKVYKL